MSVKTMVHSPQFELKDRKDLHLARKLWHMSGVGVMVLCYQFLPHFVSLGILAFIAAIFIPLDFMRLKNPELNRTALRWFGLVMRECEQKNISGMTALFLGTLVLLIFFDRPVIQLSLLFLAFADPIASLVGVKWGRDKLVGQKSLQGFLAAFVVCALISYVYFTANNLITDRIFVVVPLAGFLGALAEIIPIKKIDDNFTLPVLSGLFLSTLLYLLNF